MTRRSNEGGSRHGGSSNKLREREIIAVDRGKPGPGFVSDDRSGGDVMGSFAEECAGDETAAGDESLFTASTSEVSELTGESPGVDDGGRWCRRRDCPGSEIPGRRWLRSVRRLARHLLL